MYIHERRIQSSEWASLFWFNYLPQCFSISVCLCRLSKKISLPEMNVESGSVILLITVSLNIISGPLLGWIFYSKSNIVCATISVALHWTPLPDQPGQGLSVSMILQHCPPAIHRRIQWLYSSVSYSRLMFLDRGKAQWVVQWYPY